MKGFARTCIGLVWASVGVPSAAAALDLVSVKLGTGMICGLSGVAITLGAQAQSITGCALQRGVLYHLVVYVESAGNLGTMASPVAVTVPASNSFYTAPA